MAKHGKHKGPMKSKDMMMKPKDMPPEMRKHMDEPKKKRKKK